QVKALCCTVNFVENIIVEPSTLYKKEKIEYVPIEREEFIMPEIYNGKNIVDFLDADILDKLGAIPPLETNKSYDVLTKEDYYIKSLINDARSARKREHIDKRRQSLPEAWKRRIIRKEVTNPGPIVKVKKSKIQKEKIYKKPVDKRPAHIFKSRRVKHGNRRR
ncbi:hypothetical protein H311_02194, partial [Anncaliia algerae PRA109]